MRVLLPLCCCAILGCSGGGADQTRPTPAPKVETDGLYRGTVTSPDFSGPIPAWLLITASNARFILDNGATYRSGSFFDQASSPDAHLWFYQNNGLPAAEGSASVTTDTGKSISGTFALSNNHSGSFSLTYDAANYETDASIGSLSGTWTTTDTTLTIDSGGEWFEQRTNGCTSTGTVSVVDPNHALYSIVIDQTCGDNGPLRMVGWGFTYQEDGRQLVFMVSTGSFSFTRRLTLQ